MGTGKWHFLCSPKLPRLLYPPPVHFPKSPGPFQWKNKREREREEGRKRKEWRRKEGKKKGMKGERKSRRGKETERKKENERERKESFVIEVNSVEEISRGNCLSNNFKEMTF